MTKVPIPKILDFNKNINNRESDPIERLMAQDETREKGYSETERIRFIYSNLPASKYVTDQLIGFIFSTELYSRIEETEDENEARTKRYNLGSRIKHGRSVSNNVKKAIESNKKLQKFLNATNVEGFKNIDMLRKATLESLVYGEVGIRFLSEDEGIVLAPINTYIAVTVPSERHFGVDEILYYAINTKKEEIKETSSSVLEKIRQGKVSFDSQGVLRFEDTDIIAIKPELFQTIENVPVTGMARSPLLNDVKRISLLLSVYEQLIDDIIYDGSGRIVLWPDTSQINAVGISAGNETGIYNDSEDAKKELNARIEEIIRNVMIKFKYSSSDDVLALNEFFKERIDHLPRTTKATDFLDWISSEVEIVCQIFGVPPQLLGTGRILGNISMEMIITNAMLNVIIPMRQRYASKISKLLKNNLGIGEVMFHAENYADKSRYEDANVLSLITERLNRAECIEESKEVASMILDLLQRTNKTNIYKYMDVTKKSFWLKNNDREVS